MTLENESGCIVVSGAAGQLGSAVVQALLGSGSSVIAIDTDADRLRKVCGEPSQHLATIVGDALNPAELRKMLDEGEARVGPLAGAVHAAYPRTADWGTSFEKVEKDSLYQNLGDQLGGTILFSRETSSRLVSHGGGSVVLISSIQGIRAPKFDHYAGLNMSSPAEYSAIKAGVISFTSWLAKYLKATGVRVNCVSPGGIDADQPEQFKERYRDDCLTKGLLDPEDVAGTVMFLLSDQARYLSGQNIVVDDGWSL